MCHDSVPLPSGLINKYINHTGLNQKSIYAIQINEGECFSHECTFAKVNEFISSWYSDDIISSLTFFFQFSQLYTVDLFVSGQDFALQYYTKLKLQHCD